MYKRIKTLVAHIEKVGKSLGSSVKAYNDAVGSLETNLLGSARRMHALQVSDESIAEPSEIDTIPRSFTKPELLEVADTTPRTIPSPNVA